MTVLRCASENEVASPVVPSTLRPSQPLLRRKCASAVARPQSGSPLPSTAVAIAAMTPRRACLVMSASRHVTSGYGGAASPADAVGGERRHVDEVAVLGREADDLHRAVEADQQRS